MYQQLSLFTDYAVTPENYEHHPSLMVEAREYWGIPDDQNVPFSKYLSNRGDGWFVDNLFWSLKNDEFWRVPILLNHIPAGLHDTLILMVKEYLGCEQKAAEYADSDWGTYRHYTSSMTAIKDKASRALYNHWTNWIDRHYAVKQAFWSSTGYIYYSHFWLPTQPRPTYGMLLPVGYYNEEIYQSYKAALEEIVPEWDVVFLEKSTWIIDRKETA